MYRFTRYKCAEKISYFNRHNVTTISRTIDDMPHPKGLPLIGTKLELFAAGGGSMLHKYIDRRHKQFGPIFYEILEGNTKLVFINDPILMKTLFLNLEGKYPAHILPDPWVLYGKLYGFKRGLFFMDGEEWLINRRITNKHLLRENSETWIADPVKNTIQNFILKWRQKAMADDNFSPNLESDLYQLSTDVILNVLLGTESLAQSKHYEELLTIFSESVKKIFQTTTKLYALPVHWYQQLNLKAWRDFKECVDLSLSLAQKIVREMLNNNKQSNSGLIHRLCQEKMSDQTITRIAADFVIAAGDTTAYTTLWTLLLLSKNPSVTHDLLTGTLKSRYIIKESMRLYPVAPFLTRILPKQSLLGSFQLEERTPIIASIYTSGRDENNFSKANEFLPYRWNRDDPRKKELVNHVHSASLPFALGARSCIGKKIAMLQLAEVINQIVSNFNITLEDNSEVEAITSQILLPNRDVRLKLSVRE